MGEVHGDNPSSEIYDGLEAPTGGASDGAGELRKEVRTVSRRITRSRTKSGRLRQKRADAHLKGLEKTYGEISSKRGDTHLGTLRNASGKSLSQMVR